MRVYVKIVITVRQVNLSCRISSHSMEDQDFNRTKEETVNLKFIYIKIIGESRSIREAGINKKKASWFARSWQLIQQVSQGVFHAVNVEKNEIISAMLYCPGIAFQTFYFEKSGLLRNSCKTRTRLLWGKTKSILWVVIVRQLPCISISSKRFSSFTSKDQHICIAGKRINNKIRRVCPLSF